MAEKMQTSPACSPRLARISFTRSSIRKFRFRTNSISIPASSAIISAFSRIRLRNGSANFGYSNIRIFLSCRSDVIPPAKQIFGNVPKINIGPNSPIRRQSGRRVARLRVQSPLRNRQRNLFGSGYAVRFQTKPEIAFDQIRATVAAELDRGVVRADAAYGINTEFREGITQLGLQYVVGVQSSMTVWEPRKSLYQQSLAGKWDVRRDCCNGQRTISPSP